MSNTPQPTGASRTRPSSSKFFRNAASLLCSDVLNKATTFAVYVLVGRRLGVEAFGQLALGLTVFYVFQVIATAGLPNLLTRQISQRPRSTSRIITSAACASLAVGLASMFSMQLFAIGLQYAEQTRDVLLVLSLGLVPYALALVIESAFRGNERMHFIAISNVLANTLKVGGAVSLLAVGSSIFWFAALIACVRWTILISDLACYLGPGGWKLGSVSYRRVRKLLRRSAAFLGMDIIIASWGAVDGVMLSKLMTETEVGLYAAAGQLLQPVALVYRSIVGSIFPTMCRRAKETLGVHHITRWMVAFLLLIGMPVTICLAFYADVILNVVYDDPKFQLAVPVMRLAAAGLIAHSFTSILGHALWASGRENDTLRIVSINFLASIVMSYFAITFFGLIGAAVATLLVVSLNVAQHYHALRRAIARPPVDSQLTIPLSASIAMIAVMFGLWEVDRWLAGGIGLATYAIVASAGLVIRHGGFQQLRSQFFAPLAQ